MGITQNWCSCGIQEWKWNQCLSEALSNSGGSRGRDEGDASPPPPAQILPKRQRDCLYFLQIFSLASLAKSLTMKTIILSIMAADAAYNFLFNSPRLNLAQHDNNAAWSLLALLQAWTINMMHKYNVTSYQTTHCISSSPKSRILRHFKWVLCSYDKLRQKKN